MNLTELLNMEIGERRITSSDCRADDITEIIRVPDGWIYWRIFDSESTVTITTPSNLWPVYRRCICLIWTSVNS